MTANIIQSNQLLKTQAGYVPVPQFYNDKSLFITGGTGFMGKVSKFNNFHRFLPNHP